MESERQLKQDVLLLLRKQQLRIEQLERERLEAIAVVGIACRFPGDVTTPAEFWRLLEQGVDAVTEVPQDRWDVDGFYAPDPEAPGKMYTRYGAFLRDLDQFDPVFFGISPREAYSMDPQQRLLLEVAWEALENAGIASDQLKGSKTGVFVGSMANEYANSVMHEHPERIESYTATGGAGSFLAGRLSYQLGLRGPSVPVDTACSSSLVATHLACRSLRSGDCDLALAGGVNLILSPLTSVATAKLRALSPDGRCKTFDASADGYGRGEGCGIVVLKRLSQAQVDGDHILAVLRGSAVNHVGASGGLTVPSAEAQQEVILEALNDAAIKPCEISYVEAHGTGTSLGDPIEVRALWKVLGEGRSPNAVLTLGSVKTNIGHLEGAAGIAGLIKTILALHHESIPQHLHFKTLNPHIAAEKLPVQIPVAQLDWPTAAVPRRAGVSAFGLSGINAHIVVEEAPKSEAASQIVGFPRASQQALDLSVQDRPTHRKPHVLTLSARDPGALQELAARYARYLESSPEVDLTDFCYTANITRTHFEYRAAIEVETRAELINRLDALGADNGRAIGEIKARPKVGFLFTGQGSQYPGMARQLYDDEPLFRQTLDRCAELLAEELPCPLLEVMFEDQEVIHETLYAQPAIFSLQVALASLWESWGVQPDFVLGHSVGEYAAAWAAKVWSLEDAVRLVARRGHLMQQMPTDGAMVAVVAAADQVTAETAESPSVSVAAFNGAHTVLSGPARELESVLKKFSNKGISWQRLKTARAFHSQHLDPLLDDFQAAVANVAVHPPQVTWLSNVTGAAFATDAIPTASYWRDQAREPVQFQRGVESLARGGCQFLLELGPNPVLSAMALRCWPSDNTPPKAVACLREGRSDARELDKALASVYVAGITPHFANLYPHGSNHKVTLPNYPFQRQRYWLDPTPRLGRDARDGSKAHALLGSGRTSARTGEVLFASRWTASQPACLADHCIHNQPVVPGAVYASMACEAAGLPCQINNLVFRSPLPLGESGCHVQLSMSAAAADGQREFQLFSSVSQDADAKWVLHASGKVQPIDVVASSDSIERLRGPLSESPVESFYDRLADLHLSYGPAFRRIQRLWSGDREALALISSPGELSPETLLHPAMLDACFQTVAGVVGGQIGHEPYVPLEITRFELYGPTPSRIYCHANVLEQVSDTDTIRADLRLLDETGGLLGIISGLLCKRISPASLQRALCDVAAHELLYVLNWEKVERGSHVVDESPGTWMVLANSESTGAAFHEELAAHGQRCITVAPGTDFERCGSDTYRVNPFTATDIDRIVDQVASHGTPALRGFVLAWGIDAQGNEPDDPTLVAEQLCAAALHAAQSVLRHENLAPTLWLLTRGAQAVAGQSCMSPAAAPLWGLGRVLATEHPQLRCRLLDLDPTWGESIVALVNELLASGGESQQAWRDGQVYLPRLAPLTHTRDEPSSFEPEHRLAFVDRGQLDRMKLSRLQITAPMAGTVQLRVRAAGLNFRDVLNAMGIYPGPEGELGIECSGEVTAVGEGVQALHVGDEVVGFTMNAFASISTTPAELLVRKPSNLTFAAAATIPIAFCTVQLAFHELARLQPGERVLIHSAAGGVGMAAIQMAQCIGAEVFATASRPKWDHLRQLGVEHIFDSRTLRFADDILNVTGGKGVDVALNSLPGEYIPQTLRAVCHGGRFIEIGKRDIWSAQQVTDQRPDIQYHILALDADIAGNPSGLGQLLRKLIRRFETGELRPLPHTVYPLNEAAAGFRLMQQGGHIGKIVFTPAPSDRLDPEATYLITGGLGALGLETAHWLVQCGVRHLVLTSRRSPSAAAQESIAQLKEAGCQVQVVPCDVADEEQLRGLLAQIDATMPPLRGLIHAAGVLDDGVLQQQDWSRFQNVLAPKVHGAWQLHKQTCNRPLDFFLMFSSAASLLGPLGQSNYAAGNAFLDALAHHRRACGLPALSVNWGPWADSGMAAGGDAHDRFASRGLSLLTPPQAFTALSRLRKHGAVQASVLHVNWNRFADAFQHDASSPLLQQMLDDRKATAPTTNALLDKVGRTPIAQRLTLLVKHLQGEVRQVLSLHADPNPQKGFADMGMDSLLAVELRNRLQAQLGEATVLPTTLVFDHPNIHRLATHLEAQLEEHSPAPETLAPVVGLSLKGLPEKSTHAEPFAVIGLGCRFPGAPSPERFWTMLSEGKDAIREVPADRWDLERYYDSDPDMPGKMYARHGGFLDRLDGFDAEFFGIAPREAAGIDPQHRLLLEVTWEALEHAGLSPEQLRGTRTGVFIGISTNDYSQLLTRLGPSAVDAYLSTGTSHSVAAGRISFLLGFEGPSFAIDTACSSSLVAVHEACQHLGTARCDLAVVGGVNAILSPEMTINFCKARMLSNDGRCKTFDAAADGYVRGEGCGVVVLKRLADAKRDGDRILGVIRGSAVNQDGASSGLTVPHGPSQVRVIQEALVTAGLPPTAISYVEAHGTGTSLGDPIEVQALAQALAHDRSSEQPLWIGSVKTNIGHLEAAAGVAGLIKVVLALQHREIPAHLHFHTPNPHIPWDKVAVSSGTRSWSNENEHPLVAGISSFGFSGTNAHVIVEEAPPVPSRDEPHRSLDVLCLSARTEPALVALARKYVTRLADLDEVDFRDFCHTANTGRAPMEHRLCFTAATIGEAREKLSSFLCSKREGDLYHGRAFPGEHAKVAFVFGDHDPSMIQVARDFYDTQPTFRAALTSCLEMFRDHGQPALLPLLLDEVRETSVHDFGIRASGPAAMFAVQYALSELLSLWGGLPALVTGHGVGRFAAGCLAKVISLEDAVKLVVAHAALANQSIAPTAEEDCDDESAWERFTAACRRTSFQPSQLGFLCSVSDDLVSGETATAEHWVQAVRTEHSFEEGFYDQLLSHLISQQCNLCVNFGPWPKPFAEGGCSTREQPEQMSGLRPPGPRWITLLECLARLYSRGAAVDWIEFYRNHARRPIDLPTYPFQRRKCWIPVPEHLDDRASQVTRPTVVHPLLGRRVRSAARGVQFEMELSPTSNDILRECHLSDNWLLPTTTFLEMAYAAAAQIGLRESLELSDLTVRSPLTWSDGECRLVQVFLTPRDDGEHQFEVFFWQGGGTEGPEWNRCARGTLKERDRLKSQAAIASSEFRSALQQEVSVSDHLKRLRQDGFSLDHQGALTRMWQSSHEVLARIELPTSPALDNSRDHWHPTLHAGVLQTMLAASEVAAPDSSLWLPAQCARAHLSAWAGKDFWIHILLAGANEAVEPGRLAKVRLIREDGQSAAELDNVQMQPVTTPQDPANDRIRIHEDSHFEAREPIVSIHDKHEFGNPNE